MSLSAQLRGARVQAMAWKTVENGLHEALSYRASNGQLFQNLKHTFQLSRFYLVTSVGFEGGIVGPTAEASLRNWAKTQISSFGSPPGKLSQLVYLHFPTH